jgi:hypothetical protein
MMEKLCCGKYTKAHADIMEAVEHLWQRLLGLGFTGQQWQPMQEI